MEVTAREKHDWINEKEMTTDNARCVGHQEQQISKWKTKTHIICSCTEVLSKVNPTKSKVTHVP